MTCCSTRFLRTFSWGVVECMTVEAAELVIATSGLELRAVVVDQNLEGHARELAAFARKISAIEFRADVRQRPAPSPQDRSISAKAVHAVRPVGGGPLDERRAHCRLASDLCNCAQ